MVRWVLGGILCLIVGGFMVFRTPVPNVDQLTTLTGPVVSAEVVEQRSRRSRSERLVVVIGNNAAAYYLDRFPDFERLATALRPGDKVTALVDVGKGNYIWQLEKGGQRLVSYEQVAEAQRSNNRNMMLLGAVFIVTGIGIIVVMAYQWRTGANGAPPPKAPEGEEEETIKDEPASPRPKRRQTE
jgi:hypothetical protein